MIDKDKLPTLGTSENLREYLVRNGAIAIKHTITVEGEVPFIIADVTIIANNPGPMTPVGTPVVPEPKQS